MVPRQEGCIRNALHVNMDPLHLTFSCGDNAHSRVDQPLTRLPVDSALDLFVYLGGGGVRQSDLISVVLWQFVICRAKELIFFISSQLAAYQVAKIIVDIFCGTETLPFSR